MTSAKRGASALLSAALAIAILTSAGGVSSAAQPDDDSVSSDTTTGDLLETATEDGAAQERFSQLIESLEGLGDDVIIDVVWYGSSGAIVVSPGYVSTANRLADQVGADAIITAGNGLPFADRAELETTAMEAVAETHDIVFGARYDPIRNALVITVYVNESDLGPGDLRSIAGSAHSVTKGSGIDIVVETTTEYPPMTQSTTQGGENYGTGCTGGFIGWRGSVQGIITARHCTTTPSTYDGDTTGSTTTATSYDLRFTALSGGSPENKIRISSSSFRTITSYSAPYVGMSICKYGRTTGYGCGTVEAYYGCLYTGGNTYACGLYYTTSRMTEGGDSGGPWFYGNCAYGIHYGADSASSWLTGINYAKSSISAYPKTV